MSASAATRLRQLATQYHGGELDLHSYRRLRAELLDRLTSSESEPDVASTTLPQRLRPAAATAQVAPIASVAEATSLAPAPEAPPPKPLPPVSRPAGVPQAASVPQAPAPRKSVAGTFVFVALVAAIGVGAAWYVFLRPTALSPGATSQQVDTTSESYVAINDFVAADDWSDDQIANFNARWTTMPEDVRAAALDQPWYQNFVQRVRLRVKEQRALTATADSAGTVEGPLAALASSLGIDISSPDAVVPPRKEVIAADAGAGSNKTLSSGPPAAAAKSVGKQPKDLTAASAAAKGAAAQTATPSPGKPAASALRPAAAAAGGKAAAPQVVSEADNPDRCRIELVGSRKPRCRDALSIGGFGPFLALIRADTFEMGSKHAANEQPVHRVTIARPFAIAEFEASQAEYRLFCTETQRACEAQPWAGDDFPVVRVNWQDARDYVAWLTKVSGRNYRLATEAEWEFAARSGGAALYPSGEALSPTDAVFSQSDRLSAPWPRSRRINANTFRLYHSIGNVREWVEDAWSANFTGAPADGSARDTADTALRVVRGGAYSDTTPKLRFTTREGLDPKTRDTLTGFRVVREL